MKHCKLLLLVFLVGCAGQMDGLVQGTGQRVVIEYTQGFAHDNLKVKMPDGETFTGKAVMVGHSTSIGRVTTTSGSATTSSIGVFDTYTGSAEATLFGDEGGSMRCKLQYADSSGFTTFGGVGLCKSSDEELIDIKW